VCRGRVRPGGGVDPGPCVMSACRHVGRYMMVAYVCSACDGVCGVCVEHGRGSVVCVCVVEVVGARRLCAASEIFYLVQYVRYACRVCLVMCVYMHGMRCSVIGVGACRGCMRGVCVGGGSW